MEDQNAVAEYLKAGVDLPELKEEPKEETPPEPEKKEETQDLPETKEEPRKRSIYDEYKEKKAELRSEKEMREQAERERDEYRAKLESLNNAGTQEERQDAQDELEAFARKINADPQALREMRELFLKEAKPDESLQRDLQEFKTWKTQNAQMLEKQLFEDEFKKVTPSLKEMFPTASDEEMEVIKAKLDEVSHSKAYHDKELDYVAYKERTTLQELVSPKKRGLEPKSRRETEEESFDFDPNADYSKMTPKQREAWEANYKKLTKSTELLMDSEGRKIII